MTDYNINTDPRMKPKILRADDGTEKVIEHCYGCPHYERSELKDWEFCRRSLRDVQMRIGQRFPIWCPLEPKDAANV